MHVMYVAHRLIAGDVVHTTETKEKEPEAKQEVNKKSRNWSDCNKVIFLPQRYDHRFICGYRYCNDRKLRSTADYYNITLLQNFNNCARHARTQTTDITDHLHHHEGQLLSGGGGGDGGAARAYPYATAQPASNQQPLSYLHIP